MAKLHMAHASTHGACKPPGPKEERTMTKTMASYTLQRHLGWRTQSNLGQKKRGAKAGKNNGQLCIALGGASKPPGPKIYDGRKK